jgi:flavin-dependent dehydrogenase
LDAHLIALYATSTSPAKFQLNRTVIEAVPRGWWYAARLPSSMVIAGFHTHREDARHLLADPKMWRDALDETLHLGPLLTDTQFEHPPQSLDAGGARLDPCMGEGWIACGDAALSFDPISGQGLYSALHGGLAAGLAVVKALSGQDARFRDYARQLDNVRRTYVARCRAVYRSEHRWTAEPFWTTSAADIFEQTLSQNAQL